MTGHAWQITWTGADGKVSRAYYYFFHFALGAFRTVSKWPSTREATLESLRRTI